nr:alpha/beta hydrolase [uncultured Flavobacterium sp.]
MNGKIIYEIKTKSLGVIINTIDYLNPKWASAIAYRFFSRPSEGKLTLKELNPLHIIADKEYIELNQKKVQVYKWENGPKKVLLVHGWESNSMRWSWLIYFLKFKRYTFISLDAPAQGLSGGEELNVLEYANYLQLVINKYEPEIVIGHSMGGAVSLYHQSIHNSPSIKKMIIMGAPFEFTSIADYYKKLIGMNDKAYRHFLRFIEKRFNFEKNTARTINFTRDYQTKGLVIHDTEDTTVNFSNAQQIIKTWKNATLLKTTGKGHALQDDSIFLEIEKFIWDEN